MDIDKVRALTDTELVTELATAKRHLYDLRFQLATRQLTDYSQIPHTRRRIARILTVMTERQLSEATVPAFVPTSEAGGNGRAARPAAAVPAASPPEPAKETAEEAAEEAAEPTRSRPTRVRAAAATTTARRARSTRPAEGRSTSTRSKDEDKKETPAPSRRSGTRTGSRAK